MHIKYNPDRSLKENEMLKIFRQKHVTKFVLWAILILILPAFVIWGTGAGGRSKDKGPTFAGTIHGKKVSFDEFANSLTSVRCQVIMNYFNQPKVMETFLSSKAFIGKLGWDRLLMVKEARKAKIKIADADVIRYIRSHPIFLRNGQFDDRVYAYILRHNIGLDPRSFEEMVRENLGVQKLNAMVTKDITISDEEIVESYRKENEKFKISYILFASEGFVEKTAASDAEAQEYYDDHKSEFTLPPKESSAAPGSQAVASFDDVKASVKAFLAEGKARKLAVQFSNDQYGKLKDLMDKEKLAFEAAAAKLGLKTQESGFFLRSEYLDGIGDSVGIIDTAVTLKAGEISGPVEARKGAVIFRLVETQAFDKEKFAKEKASYTAKALDAKKMLSLEDWLRGLEKINAVNIDFKDYEKYYR